MARNVVLWIAAILLFATAESAAIVIRHDRDDAQFRHYSKEFPAAVHVLPGETGTLVRPRFVLTAAHVAQGLQRSSTPRVVIDGKEYAVDRIFQHPDWSGRGAHDVGVLRLAQAATGVPIAQLYRWADEEGQQVTFVGWGDTGTGLTGPTARDDRKRAATNRVDGADNDWLYFTFNKPGEGATELEGISGPGDSGGPAFVERDGLTYVLGVSAYGFQGKPGHYGTREAYTRISTHVSWIESVLSGAVDQTGVAPGATRETNDNERAVTRRNPSGQDLARLPGGAVVLAYLEAYNSADDSQMSGFVEEHFSADYRKRKTTDEQLSLYHRLQEEIFGHLILEEVVEATGSKINIRVSSEKQKDGELHFTLDADHKIDDLMVAIIDFSR